MYGYAPQARQEVSILAEQGIQVTSARFIVYQQTYPINGITSVAPFSFQPGRAGPLLGILFFGLASLGGIVSAINGDGSPGAAVFCLAMLGLCIWWFMSRKMQHGVIVSTAGMQHRALVTPDPALVHRVVGALNQAISMR